MVKREESIIDYWFIDKWKYITLGETPAAQDNLVVKPHLHWGVKQMKFFLTGITSSFASQFYFKRIFKTMCL